jgi:hypothetical protein
MRQVYPPPPFEGEMFCSEEIFVNCDLCRAQKTGHLVSSVDYPQVCKQFLTHSGKEHVCIPMIVGGRAAGVVQSLFDVPQNGEHGYDAVKSQIFKADTYIRQSQSAIEAKRLMNALRESAVKDALTGLYNRRAPRVSAPSRRVAARPGENCGLGCGGARALPRPPGGTPRATRAMALPGPTSQDPCLGLKSTAAGAARTGRRWDDA